MSETISAPDQPQLPLHQRDGSDRDMFTNVVTENLNVLLSRARQHFASPEDAEDALQEILTKSWASPTIQPDQANLMPWFRTAIHNAAVNNIRDRRSGVNRLIDGSLDNPNWHCLPPTETDPTLEEVITRETHSEVLAALSLLADQGKRDTAQMIVLDALGLTPQEIARYLGISHGAARVRAHRARIAVRAILEPQLDEAA